MHVCMRDKCETVIEDNEREACTGQCQSDIYSISVDQSNGNSDVQHALYRIHVKRE